MKKEKYKNKYLFRMKNLVLLIVLNAVSGLSFSQAIPCNTSSPWVNGSYTNLSAQINDDVPSVVPLCLGSVSNISNLSDADLDNFSTISITGLNCNATIGVKDNDPADTYPAGAWAGFRVGTAGLLSGATIASTVTITTWNNGVQRETYNAVTNLAGLNSSLLNNDGTANIGFITSQNFDEIRIQYQALVGILYTTQVYYAVVKRYCTGPAPASLPCNQISRLSGNSYPAAIEITRTGTTGITLGNIRNTENAVSDNDADYAAVTLPAGILATGSISVHDMITDYPAGNFAGFDIENASLLGIGLLNHSSIRTYLNGTLQETKTGNTLLLSAAALSGTSRQTVGFITSLPYDEIQYTVSQPLGLSLDTTKIYGAVMKRHCAGPALVCNTPVTLAGPAYPVNINGSHTGISGAVCVNCNIYNPSNITDAIDTTYATISFTAAIAVNGSVAVKDEMETYTSGTFAGFKIENNNILGVNVLNNISVTTYLNGVMAETRTGDVLLISANADTLCLAGNSGPQRVGFVSALPFNEVQLTMHQPVGVTLGITKVYGAVMQKFCAALMIPDTTYWLTNPDFPVIVDNFNTGISGVACVGCAVQHADNLVDDTDSTYATIKISAGAVSEGTIAVAGVLSSFPEGSFAGFAIRDMNNLLKTDLLQSITIATYMDGTLQESKTNNGLLTINPLISIMDTAVTGNYNIGFYTEMPYDEIRLSAGNVAALLNEIRVYGALIDTRTAPRTEPDIAVTSLNVTVNGNLRSNDAVPAGTEYGIPVPMPGNPAACLPVVATDGTYEFVCGTAGEYNYLVPVCPKEIAGDCMDELLTITVLNTSVLTNPPTANPDVATTMEGNAVNVNVLANDRCNNGLNCALSNPTVATGAANGTVVINVNGTLTYTPAPGFTGKDSLLYAVCDNQIPEKCDSEFVYITVLPAGTANSTDGNDDYALTLEKTPVTGNVLANDIDPENNVQTVTPQNITDAIGTFVLDADGMYTFTPADGFTGPVSFPYSVCDNGSPSACDNATLHIMVRQAPDLTPSVTATPNIMHGVTVFNITVRVTELNNVTTEGPLTIRIPKDNRLSFAYNQADNFIGAVPVTNNVWSYDNSNAFFHIFTCNSTIQPAAFSTFGFVATFNPQNSSGVYTLTATLVSGSGSEVRTNNNTDAESIDYFNN